MVFQPRRNSLSQTIKSFHQTKDRWIADRQARKAEERRKLECFLWRGGFLWWLIRTMFDATALARHQHSGLKRFLEHRTPLTMMDQSQDGFHGLEWSKIKISTAACAYGCSVTNWHELRWPCAPEVSSIIYPKDISRWWLLLNQLLRRRHVNMLDLGLTKRYDTCSCQLLSYNGRFENIWKCMSCLSLWCMPMLWLRG